MVKLHDWYHYLGDQITKLKAGVTQLSYCCYRKFLIVNLGNPRQDFEKVFKVFQSQPYLASHVVRTEKGLKPWSNGAG